MTAVSRLRIAWSGAGVTGGGVTTWHTEGDPLQLQLAAKAFFGGSLLSRLPTNVSLHVPASGETFESTTGVLTGLWSSGTAGTYAGTSANPYAGGVGCRIVWNTSGVTRGRRVRGSTYIVPLVNSMYDSDGSIANTIVTAFTTEAQAVIVAMGNDFCIYSRPKPGDPGDIWTVESVTVPDRVSWLRSRRT